MKTQLRDVLLLGAAMSAFMLLVVLSPVGAEEVAAPAAARVAANATTAIEVRLAAKPTTATKVQADDEDETLVALELERPCDRVRRIGKFTVTRCD